MNDISFKIVNPKNEEIIVKWSRVAVCFVVGNQMSDTLYVSLGNEGEREILIPLRRKLVFLSLDLFVYIIHYYVLYFFISLKMYCRFYTELLKKFSILANKYKKTFG